MIEGRTGKEREPTGRFFYHATWAERLPSIMERGLDPSFSGQNFKCEPGIYLAGSAGEASMMLLDAKARSSQAAQNYWEPLKDMSIISIEATRIERALLKPDPQAHSSVASWRYEGKIEVRGCTVSPASPIAATPARLAKGDYKAEGAA